MVITLAENASSRLITEWHPTLNGEVTPALISAHTATKYWWQCSVDDRHEWEAPVNKRQAGQNCPICSNRKIVEGLNDLLTTDAEIAAEWDSNLNSRRATEVGRGSSALYHWKCTRNHQWIASPANRTKKNSGCPFCAGQLAIPGENDLATLIPALAAEWHPRKNNQSATEVMPGSGRKAWWLCPQCSHEWESQIRTRGVRGYGCPRCNGSGFVRVGENDLASQLPEIAATWEYELNSPRTPESVSYQSAQRAWWKCAEGHIWESYIYNRRNRNCPDCNREHFVSRGEDEVAAELEKLDIKVVRNARDLIQDSNKELDIYLPDYKFAIEFNGVYWHSEAAGKFSDYHKDKMDKIHAAGISLYQVWQDDWSMRREVVLRGILHRIGLVERMKEISDIPEWWLERIGARKLRNTIISNKAAEEFLNAHHIQGFTTGSAYFGLLDDDQRIRAVLVTTIIKDGKYSIDRYATAGIISGGFTKILKYATDVLSTKIWVTFADSQISDGGLYKQNGFTADAVIDPDYSYLVKGRRVHKFNYRLDRFRKDPELEWSKGLTERELAELNGLTRIWDSGKVRYVLVVE